VIEMSEARWIARVHGLLLNAAQKRAWGESVEEFDPGSLAEELRPAITDAIRTANDRGAVASTLLALYQGHAGSGSDTVSMIFQACLWTGSSTLHAAFEKAIQKAGPAVVEVLREALVDEADEDTAVDFLFDACQSAVDAIQDPANKLEALQNAYRRALSVTEEPDVLKTLTDGLSAASPHGQDQAAQILFDYFRNEAALGMSSDPWPLLEELIASLQTCDADVSSDEEALDVLLRTLQEVIAEEGALSSLWEGYQSLLDEKGEFEGLENTEALLEAHAQLIRAGADTQWLVDAVCDVCLEIAHARDDESYLLPDRQQVSDACMATIRLAMTPAAVRNLSLQSFQCAVSRCDDAWSVLSKAYRKMLAKAEGQMERPALIANILIRASYEAVETVLWKDWISARRVVEGYSREQTIALLLKSARSKSDARSAIDQVAPSAPMADLLRALEASAAALDYPTAAANLVGFVFAERCCRSNDRGIDHLMSTFTDALSAWRDPQAETEFVYDAYTDAILQDDDPGAAVEILVHGARDTILNADDPEAAIEVFLDGLSVKPSGWPPPTPAWLTPE